MKRHRVELVTNNFAAAIRRKPWEELKGIVVGQRRRRAGMSEFSSGY